MSAGGSAPFMVPAPPPSLSCNLMILSAGTVIHRVHDARFEPDAFNPGLGSSRFAPFESGGTPVPTIYAATSFACAAFETIFHDIEPGIGLKSVRWSLIETLRYSTVALHRDVRLAKLFFAGLLKWDCARAQIVDTPRCAYPRTRLWSAAIHDSDPAVDGMIWPSRKYDEERAMILFGSRFAAEDLTARSTVKIIENADALRELRALATASDILIAR